MVALPRLQSVNPRIAAIGGGGCALLVAAAIALMPTALLENLVWTSGVAALVPAAEPPLGITARAVLAIAAGGLAGAVCWSVLYLLVGPGGFLVGKRPAADAVPVVRRADAHPDAPPRRPISAADLGVPMMDAAWIERPIPKNLEQPLAAFDPAAMPAAPRAPVHPVAPLSRPCPDAPIETAEPVETVDTAPAVTEPAPVPDPAPEPAATPESMPEPEPEQRSVVEAPPPSIEALLRRLEQGAHARVAAR